MRNAYKGTREITRLHIRLMFCLEMELDSVGRFSFIWDGSRSEIPFQTCVSACAEQ